MLKFVEALYKLQKKKNQKLLGCTSSLHSNFKEYNFKANDTVRITLY